MSVNPVNIEQQNDLYKALLYYTSFMGTGNETKPTNIIKYNYVVQLKVGDIPYGTTHLIIGEKYNKILDYDVIPNTVTHLTFENSLCNELKVGVIPDSVTHLYFNNYKCCPLKKGIIPKSVTHLSFMYDLPRIIHMPDSIISLKMGDSFNYILLKISFIWPKNLKYLELSSSFNGHLDEDDLPKGITHLIFGNNFNQELDENVLPEGLLYLKFGDNFNQPLNNGIIPKSVKQLIFGYDFNQILKKGDIPNSVTHLTFGQEFNQPLNNEILPFNLKHLCLGSLLYTYHIYDLPPYVIEVITHYDCIVKLPLSRNNILIGIIKYDDDDDFDNNIDDEYNEYDHRCIAYNYNNMNINVSIKQYEYVNNINKHNLFGNIILKELLQKTLMMNIIN